MTANTNPKTGIAYGYVAASDLEPEVVSELMYGHGATDLSYDQARNDAQAEAFAEWEQRCEEIDVQRQDDGPPPIVHADFEFDDQKFSDNYQCDEPTVEGTYEGVKYRSSWLGGALNFVIFESPHVTHFGKRASPCVPNACILPPDVEQGSVNGYDVPLDWYRAAALPLPSFGTLADLVGELAEELRALGFDTDAAISGTDTVDGICQFYDRIAAIARAIENNRKEA